MSGVAAAVSNGAMPQMRKSQPIGLSGLAREIKRPQGAADRPIAVLVIKKLDQSVSRSSPQSQAPTTATTARTMANPKSAYANTLSRLPMPT